MKTILFDLDGTLTDPKEGVTKSIAYALEKFGRRTDPDEFTWCIGPPLHDSFRMLLGDDDTRVKQAVAHYRERYAEKGKVENLLYEGIPQALGALRDRGHTLYIASSKFEPMAVEVLEHFGLSSYFQAVYGSQADGSRGEKTELLEFLLRSEGLAASDCVMVGDRKFDIIAAKNNHIPSLGVTWGYGGEAELLAAGASQIISAPGQLPSVELFAG